MDQQTQNKSSELEEFIKITKRDLEKKIKDVIIDKKIVSILKGGKRLRPLLAHLSYKACTQGKESRKEYRKALEGGVVIELAHAASLVHDDIIDEDIERRGKPSYHIKKGTANAILTGHKMLVIGFNVALKHGEEWAKLYVDSWNEVVNGEIDEVNFNKKNLKYWDEISSKSEILEIYNKIINLKTAVLFSSVCKAGALEANMPEDVLILFGDYGREIGLAYQLSDDLVDLSKGEMIDSVIVPLLNQIEGSKIKTLNKMVIKRKFVKNKDKIQELYINEINKHIGKAEELSLSKKIPESKYKNILNKFPRFIINEMLKEIKIKI
jgi:geranylgeranyl pyrophosphate synthase